MAYRIEVSHEETISIHDAKDGRVTMFVYDDANLSAVRLTAAALDELISALQERRESLDVMQADNPLV